MKKSESKYFNTAKKMDMALLELLQSKPFEYITVSELCKAAGVHRSTFYLHYENACDLLEETVQGIMEDFQSYFSGDVVRMAERLRHCDTEELYFVCDTYLIPYLTFMKDNRTVILTAVKRGKSFGLDKMYERLFAHVFNPILERFHYPKADRNYVM